jgi:HEAT repeat protein
MKVVSSFIIAVALAAVLGCGGGSESGEIDIYSGSTDVADIPKHIADFKDKSHRGLVQARAMNALNSIGAPAVPALIEALGSDSVDVRLMALNTFALMGPKAKDAVPAIQKAVQDSDPDVQKRAQEVLAKVNV